MSGTTDVDDATSTDPTTTPGRPQGDVVLEGEGDPEAITEAFKRAAHPNVDEMTDPRDVAFHDATDGRLPQLRPPGFGEPEDDCGDVVLPATRFCTTCGKRHDFKHNCLRYDCPQHAPYAIRRRAAGSNSGTGIAPQLKSLLLRLYNYRDMDHYFHHLFVSLPTDEPWVFESENPLERARDLLREIMDALGIQGVLVYHPYRGADEDRESDDRGFWKDLLFHRKSWDDVEQKLEFSPHFHIVGVAPHVDVSVTEQVEAATGWVIHRRSNEEDGISLEDDDAMARALTYCLSHAGVYETETGQRRIAAWMKGPDVASTETYEKVKRTMQQKVYAASEKVLGISPPDLECSHEALVDHDHDPAEDVDDDADGSVNMASLTKPVRGPGGPAARSPFSSFGAAGGGHTDGYELQSPPTKWKDFNRPAGSWKRSSGSSSGQKDASGSGHREEAGDDVQECGGYLRHISQAGEYLLDAEWRRVAPHADDLEACYRSYVDYMTSRDLDPIDGAVPELPEERDPPPD